MSLPGAAGAVMTFIQTRSALAWFLICLVPRPMMSAPTLIPMLHEIHASAAASLPHSTETTGGAAAQVDYLIGENDVLEITVWNEPDLKQSLPVRPDGKINFPLIGEIQAADETPSQLQEAIASKLKAFITHPDVTVMVVQMNSRKFNILGRVAKPGSYPLTATTTVLDAIAEAGGFQDFAKEKDIYILRKNPTGGESRIRFNYKVVIKGKHPETNIVLEPHDTVVVP
jgi:polysaccharide biosynthesis/export protein